jgi:hypothetical protein
MTVIAFAEWRPDMPDLSQWAREALNVVPAEESYAPLNALNGVSSPLVARAQGAAWFRGTAGATMMFAGDVTKLYLLSGTTWNDVTRLASVPAQNAPSTSTTGGTLAAATYFYVITALTAAGETTKSNEQSITTSGATSSNTLTWAAVSGATGYRLYRGTATGAENVHYAVGAVTTFTDTGAAGTAGTPPVSNTAEVAYGLGGDGNWRFTQFGTIALAVNGIDNPQKFDLSVGTNWTALLGTPPVATFVTTVRDFVLMGKLGTTPQRVQWSGLDNAELWGSIPANQADFQDLPDGGNVTGLVGGEYGLIFQEAAVRRMTYEGAPIVFRIDKIANELGCSIPNSLAAVSDLAFFLHKSGFYMIQGGQTIAPIGRGKVDRFFWKEFDETNHFRSSAAIDPVRGLYVFAYPANGNNGTPNRLLIYNWRVQKWAHAQLTCEIVFGGVSQQGYTLDQLDPFGTIDTLPYSLDSSFWSGTVSLLLFAFDTNHKSGSFSGPSLAATVETTEFNPGNGQRSVVRGCRPLIDGGNPQILLGSRETQQAMTAYGLAIGLTPAGMAPLYRSGRYFRVRATMQSGDVWSNMQGIDDLDARPMGQQ